MKNVLCFILSVGFCLGFAFATGSPDIVVDESTQTTEASEVQSEEVLLETTKSESESSEISVETEDSSNDDGSNVSEVVYDEGNPLPVVLVDDDISYSVFASGGDSSSGLVITDEIPSDVPFYGAGYITGYSSTLGNVTLWMPIDYKGDWGVTSDGYLVNVTSSSKSGYLEGVYNNNFSAQAFSLPRYRTSSSSYDYVTLYITPTASNMDIAVEMTPAVTFSDVYPYMMIMLVGVVIVCFMKRW